MAAEQMDNTETEERVKPPGALECNLTGRCPFLRNSTTCLGKNLAFRYAVSELSDYRNFLKSIVLENNSLLFLNK